MKLLKKAVSLAVSLVMVLSMSIMALADTSLPSYGVFYKTATGSDRSMTTQVLGQYKLVDGEQNIIITNDGQKITMPTSTFKIVGFTGKLTAISYNGTEDITVNLVGTNIVVDLTATEMNADDLFHVTNRLPCLVDYTTGGFIHADVHQVYFGLSNSKPTFINPMGL